MAVATQDVAVIPPAQRKYKGCSSIREYDVLGKLGEGTFGEVHKAQHKRTHAVVALKKILMHNEKDGFPITALREIKLLKMLSHTNVLKLEEMAVERNKGEGRKKAILYMVTPYMDHDLSGLLENPSVRITEPIIKCYMLQLLEGIRYLHNEHILHRDMKAANLLINNRGILQIADFGLARHYDEAVPVKGRGGGDAQREYTTLVVTRWYRPPELLLQLRRYTTAIDMWGVGCVFGEMFKRKPILAGNSDLNQAQIIFELVGSPNDENMPGWAFLPGCDGVKSWAQRQGNLEQVFRGQSPLAISLLRELLKLDWRKRINAIDALEHPYFKTEPLPARPGDIPRFEESHELDRRKFRDQKAALPPAPAGGDVGMGPNGEWTGSGPPNGAWGHPGRDDRRGGGGGRGWGPPPQDRGPPGTTGGRGNGWADERGHHGYHDTRGAPPPPGPPPAGRRQPNNANPWARAQAIDADRPRSSGWDGTKDGPVRSSLPPPPAEGRHPLPRPPLGGPPNGAHPLPQPPVNRALNNRVDTYIPSYDGKAPRDDRHRRDERPPIQRDGRDARDGRDGKDYRDRDWRDHGPRDGGRERHRTRSRSPERHRERDRDFYRR